MILLTTYELSKIVFIVKTYSFNIHIEYETKLIQ